MQGTVSIPVPRHGFPPFFGAGLEQVRERVLLAVPQVAEHEDQVPQADQDPSTAINITLIRNWCLLSKQGCTKYVQIWGLVKEGLCKKFNIIIP